MRSFAVFTTTIVLSGLLNSVHAAFVQQGFKLSAPSLVGLVQQGQSVALSADGNTALVGGNLESAETGAVWVYIRNGGAWSQQGPKLVGTGGIGQMQQGYAVALSA